MKFGRYLIVMVSSWLFAAAVVVGFTLLVDPIGISPIRIAIAGFNTLKPLQQDYDWIVKRYDVRRSQPATIFMGSSRIKQSMDPKLVAKTGFAPAYNGGLNGSANFLETKAYLQDYLRADKNLHHVFIEAFATALLDNRQAERPFLAPTTSRPTVVGFGLLSDIADMMSAFFSMSGLSSAIRTVAINREHSRRRPRRTTALRRFLLPLTTSASATFSISCCTRGCYSAEGTYPCL